MKQGSRITQFFSRAQASLGRWWPLTTYIPGNARAWLDLARDERRWAEYNVAGGDYRRACIALRHSVQNLLIAFLLAHNARPPRTPRLERLLDRCAQHDPRAAPFKEAIHKLEDYYEATYTSYFTTRRRPFTKAEAQAASALVDELLNTLEPVIVDRIEGKA